MRTAFGGVLALYCAVTLLLILIACFSSRHRESPGCQQLTEPRNGEVDLGPIDVQGPSSDNAKVRYLPS